MNELSFLESLFGDVLGTDATPRVDVTECDNSYTLEMELPGRSENDVNIELDHDNLTIASKVEEKNEKAKDKPKYLLHERRVSNFTRRFTIPADIDSDSISANFKNGILTISMQKKEPTTPKKIMIAAS